MPTFLDELFSRAASLIKNDSAVSGATVKDALETLLAALVGGGAVSSVFARNGAIVAALNDYIASLVGNDSTVPGATVKDALDAIGTALGTIAGSNVANDSGVTGATIKDALEALAGAIGNTSGSQPLWLHPATPHADDEEFEGTALPSGWIIYDVTAASAIVPAGTPDPYSAPAGGAAKFAAHTNWRKSWAAFQFAATTHTMLAVKPITPTTDMALWGRVGGNPLVGDSSSSDFYGLTILADNSGVPDFNNCVAVNYLRGVGVRSIKVTAGAVVSAGNYYANAGDLQALEYFGIQKIGTDYYGHAFSDGATRARWTVLNHTPTKAWAGFMFRGEASAPGAAIYPADFLRRVDSAQGLPV